jgi:chaperonin cofactor prefoldin
MELNRQRQATRTVVQSGEAVSAKLEEVSSALRENRKLAEQTLWLQQAVERTNQRLDALEAQLPAAHSSPAEPDPEFTDTGW